jgi:hypothetical protein
MFLKRFVLDLDGSEHYPRVDFRSWAQFRPSHTGPSNFRQLHRAFFRSRALANWKLTL